MSFYQYISARIRKPHSTRMTRRPSSVCHSPTQTNNVVADALSRLNLITYNTLSPDLDKMAEHFGLDDEDLPADAFPLQYKMIAREQNKDKNLFKFLKSNTPGFHIKAFCGGSKKRELIWHNNKMIILSSLSSLQ